MPNGAGDERPCVCPKPRRLLHVDHVEDEKPEDFPEGAGREETFYACIAFHHFKLVAAQGTTRVSGMTVSPA
jgi:hypothetical protein